MDSYFCSQNSRVSFTAMDSDYNIRRGHSSPPEYYPEKFSRSRLNDATSFEKRTTALKSRKRHFEDDEALQYYSRKSVYYSSDYEFRSSPWIINMKQDTSYQSYEDICVNNMAVCAKRIKSSEVHEKSLNSQNYQSGLENTNLKKHKSCEKHSKKETSYVNILGENSKTTTCDSKLISTQLRRLENDLKLIFANKPVKKNMKLKSAPESNSTISTKRKFVKQSKPVKKSMELKSTQEICTESAKRKNSENKQKGKNTKLCCDIDDADTLILCIDEDEAFDILFGDLKSKVLKSFKAHEIKKCKEENT